MRKRILLALFATMAFGCLAWADSGSWTGRVSDDKCGAKNHDAACVRKCVDGGAKYVLVSRGKVYQLDAQDKFKDYAGERVKVAGELNGDTITVSSVEKAARKSKKASSGG